MNFRHKASLFLLSAILLVTACVTGSYAKRGFIPKKVIIYDEIKAMPKGPEASAALAELVKMDKNGFLGSKPVEELAMIYLSENKVDSLYTILEPLKRTKCANYHLIMDIAEMIVVERHDLDTAIELMTQVEHLVIQERMVPPKDFHRESWKVNTDKIVAEMRRHNAHLYRMEGQYDAARANIYQVLKRDPKSRDYEFAGELMLIDKEFRPAMGAFMSSYFLGENELAVKLFRNVYDSLKWAPAYYDKYFDEFFEMHIEETVKDIQSWGESGIAMDLENLPVSDLDNQFGKTLIFWDENITNTEIMALYRLKNLLMARGIPCRFVYFGNNLEEIGNRISKKGIYFGEQYSGDTMVQQVYQLAVFPTVLALDNQNRFLFRLEGENINMDRLFDKLWSDYLAQEHSELLMSQNIPTVNKSLEEAEAIEEAQETEE